MGMDRGGRRRYDDRGGYERKSYNDRRDDRYRDRRDGGYRRRSDDRRGYGDDRRGYSDRDYHRKPKGRYYNRETMEKTDRLYFGNMSYHTTEQEFEDLVKNCLGFSKISFPTRDGSGRGFAFVFFDSVENAENAMNELNKTELGGRTLRVEFSQSRAEPQEEEAEAQDN